jgi:hypothetical protein
MHSVILGLGIAAYWRTPQFASGTGKLHAPLRIVLVRTAAQPDERVFIDRARWGIAASSKVQP